MKLKNIILIASTLSSFHFSNGMHNEYEIIPTEKFTTIEKNFQQRFGYSIPTSEDDYQKMSFTEYINHNKVMTTQENPSTESEKIEIITRKSLRYFQQAELEKQFAAEKLRQEELIAEARLRYEKRATQEKQLREKLAALEQLALEKAAENKRLRLEQQELEKKIKEETKKNAIIEREVKKHRILKAQQKERAIKAAQKAVTPKQPVQRPEKNINAQRFALKKKLIASKDFKTEAQLKKALYQFCVEEKVPCMSSYIPNTPTVFHYSKETGELKILINDHEIDEFIHCCDKPQES